MEQSYPNKLADPLGLKLLEFSKRVVYNNVTRKKMLSMIRYNT